MGDQNVYTSGRNGALFIQPSGPGTRPYYLSCHDVDDFDIDKGTINTLIQCFNVYGNWKTLGFTRNAPGIIDVTLGTYIGKSADRLEKVSCPFALYLLLRCGGRADLITNYERMWIIDVANIGTHTLQGIVRRNEDAEAMQMFAAQAYPEVIPVFELEGVRLTTSEEKALNDIAFCNAERCQGRCGDAQGLCETGSAVGDSEDAGSPGSAGAVLNTTNTGTTWAATATNPFGAGEDVISVVCFYSPTGTNVIRKVVARGTTDAGNPMEIAWTEDNGATWNNVNVGSVNGQFAISPNAMFALDYYNIWLVTSGGYIYYSDDGGGSWTAQESGILTAGTYRTVHFVDENNGYAGGPNSFVVKTTDGGNTWSATTSVGAALIRDIHVFDSQVAILATGTPKVFKTTDGGTTWNQITTFPQSTGDVSAIDFVNDYVGAIGWTGGGTSIVYFTVDGGYTWKALTTPSNSGINSIFFCGTDLLFAVGERNNGTAFIAKFTPVS